MCFLLMISQLMTGTVHEVPGGDKSVDGRVVAFSNKPFGQTSSIVSTNIATWVLSTHVAIRGEGFTYLGS